MSAVHVFQALFWPAESPVSRTGGVDFKALAQGLARAEYRGVSVRRNRIRQRVRSQQGIRPPQGSAPRKGSLPRPPRQGYSRAQHAVVASRAVETLAVLKDAAAPSAGDARVACGVARIGAGKRHGTGRRGREEAAGAAFHGAGGPGGRAGPHDAVGCGPVEGSVVAGALVTERLLARLAGLDPADERNRIALYALFSELPPAGLSAAAADAALREAGLDANAPEWWVNVLRLARRMADETVRRDVRIGPGIERTGFPALETKIQPLDESGAARLWLERYRVLSQAGARKNGNPGTGETN